MLFVVPQLLLLMAIPPARRHPWCNMSNRFNLHLAVHLCSMLVNFPRFAPGHHDDSSTHARMLNVEQVIKLLQAEMECTVTDATVCNFESERRSLIGI